MTASFETTPIVVNGVMYITTPVVNKKMLIMAVNAATGDLLPYGCWAVLLGGAGWSLARRRYAAKAA